MIGAYCCLTCRQVCQRKETKILDRVFRPFIKCECAAKRYEEEKKKQEIQRKRTVIKQLYGEGLIDDELKRASFESFEKRKGTEKAFEVCKRFAENFEKQDTGLYLFGPVGVGKSHLAAAIHNYLEKRGYASVYIDVTQLFGKIKSTFKSKRQSDQDMIEAAIKCEFLTLDEIGLAPLTDYEYRVMFQILNGRKGKLTNFTSNLNLEQLERWFQKDKDNNPLDEHGRLFDRIIGSTKPIKINAESYRKYRAKQRVKAHE